MHVELGAYHDDGTCGVIHALTEEVLAEASLLALKGVREALEGAVALALDRGTLLGVVEETVDGFLKHTFLVAENDFGSLDLDEFLETVVTDYYATVEIVDIGGCEAAAVEGNQRTEIRGNDRNHLHDHPFGTVYTLALLEPLDYLEAFEDFGLALLRGLNQHFLAEFIAELLGVDFLEEIVDSFRTHLGDELVGIGVGKILVSGEFGKHVEVLVLCEEFVLGNIAGALAGHDVLLVVDNRFQFLGRNSEHSGYLVGGTLEIPDMRNGNGEGDVTHPLAAYLLFGNLHTAAVAYDAAVANPLVFPAIALVVLSRTEDLLAEETVAFRLVCTVVDGFRLQDLSTTPFYDVFRRCQRDADRLEIALYLIISIIEIRHILVRLSVILFQRNL